MPNVAAVVAKYEAAAAAEPAPEGTPGTPPSAGASGAGSASADASSSPEQHAGDASPAEAPNETHAVLEAKLAADRNRRLTKAERKAVKAEAARQAEITRQLEADRKEAEEAKTKWANIGKDPKASWLDTIKAAGKEPRQVYEEMRAEAMKAGTPEARIEALEAAFDARIKGLEKELADEREGTRKREQTEQTNRERQEFTQDFQREIADDRFGSLLIDYEPPQLFRLADQLRANPGYLMQQARALGVNLTADDGTFNMTDILSVMKASADAYHEGRQRRSQSAAPQSSTAAPTQAPEATKPTVNGTQRKAGSTISNDLAASRATEEAARLKGMTRRQRVEYLARKHG